MLSRHIKLHQSKRNALWGKSGNIWQVFSDRTIKWLRYATSSNAYWCLLCWPSSEVHLWQKWPLVYLFKHVFLFQFFSFVCSYNYIYYCVEYSRSSIVWHMFFFIVMDFLKHYMRYFSDPYLNNSGSIPLSLANTYFLWCF